MHDGKQCVTHLLIAQELGPKTHTNLAIGQKGTSAMRLAWQLLW